MKTTKLNRIGVVVYDLDKAKAEYERVYGINEWETAEVTPSEPVSYGRKLTRTPGTWRSAIGTTGPRAGESGPTGEAALPVTFELIEPTGGESPFNEHLRIKREGIAFIQVACDASDQAQIAAHFEGLGIPPVYEALIDGSPRTFFDTRDELGGFLVEMVPASEDRTAPAAESAPMPVQGIFHFGVLVHDVLKAVPHYRDIFGIDVFETKTWETGAGRLDDPYYRGEKTVNGYFTAQGRAEDFGFEIIEMTHGECHYNKEFFDIRGPGIHHFFGWMTKDDAEWDRVVKDMTDAGHPLIMGSDLRGGAAEFGYFDTFDALGGYLIEIVVRRRTPDAKYAQPDWIIDYGELA